MRGGSKNELTGEVVSVYILKFMLSSENVVVKTFEEIHMRSRDFQFKRSNSTTLGA